jgi:putative transposase
MIGVLKEAEVGVPVAELIRKVGISERTFYRRKKQYIGMEVNHVASTRCDLCHRAKLTKAN